MLDALQSEIIQRTPEVKFDSISTIYFGGGTPSILSIQEIEVVLNSISSHYSLDLNPEITLEANPDDLNRHYLKELNSLGINRLSIGIQSFHESDLQWMNRAHTSIQSHHAIQFAIDEGFENINCDLIFGIPNSSDQIWSNNISQMIQYQIPHLSCYALTVEEKTKLYSAIRNKQSEAPDDEHTVRQMNILFQIMSEHGYEAYEISNYCKPGFRSKHNSNYWQGKPYLGFGPAAHSFHNTQRRWNISNNNLYIQYIESNLPYYETEELSRRDLFNEYIMVNLRRMEGIDTEYILEYHSEFYREFINQLNQLNHSKYFIKNKNSYSLTNEGKIMSDWIIRALFQLA